MYHYKGTQNIVMDLREHQEWVSKETGKLYSVDWCIGNSVGYSDGDVKTPGSYYDPNPKYQDWMDEGSPEFDPDGDTIYAPEESTWVDNHKSMKDIEFVDKFKCVKEADWWLEEIGEREPRVKLGQLWEWRQHFDKPMVDMTGMSLEERLKAAVRVFKIVSIKRDLNWDPNKRGPRTMKADPVTDSTGTYHVAKSPGAYCSQIHFDWRIPLLWERDDMRLIADIKNGVLTV
jgi:hypothetical protein